MQNPRLNAKAELVGQIQKSESADPAVRTLCLCEGEVCEDYSLKISYQASIDAEEAGPRGRSQVLTLSAAFRGRIAAFLSR